MKLPVLILTCLLALPTWGASASLEALRSESQGARDAAASVRVQQLRHRTELSTLSSRIETLKAAARGKLLPGGELDAALKRSQELSGILSQLALQVADREAAVEAASVALLEGLSFELNRVRTQFEAQSDRATRRNLIEQLRKLRSEREALRQSLPAIKVPALDPLRPSGDPEELLEQADLLRDHEEKVRRELKVLEVRLAERREEVELDRRVQRFMGEESSFDDQDVRLRVERTVTISGGPAAAYATPGESAPPTPGSKVDTSAGFTADGPSPAALGLSETKGRAQEGNTFGTGPDSSSIRVTRASDARVQVGGSRGISGGDDDLADLEVERARLQSLVKELKKKADELEQQASQLK